MTSSYLVTRTRVGVAPDEAGYVHVLCSAYHHHHLTGKCHSPVDESSLTDCLQSLLSSFEPTLRDQLDLKLTCFLCQVSWLAYKLFLKSKQCDDFSPSGQSFQMCLCQNNGDNFEETNGPRSTGVLLAKVTLFQCLSNDSQLS